MMTDDNAEKLTNRYNREAQYYQRLWAPVLRTAGLQLLDELGDFEPHRILDVATGVGVLLPDLRDRFPHAFIAGVDRSSGMLALVNADVPRAVMDARQLAIASDAIDLVLMAFVLFHLNNPMEGLLEVRRVLRMNGRIGTITWATELESLAQLIWNECLEAYGAPPPDPDAQARHSAVDTPEKVAALLQTAGFTTSRAWLGRLAAMFDMERLLERWTHMGASKPRFDALNEEAQAACVLEARKRMAALPPEGFEMRGKIVFALARV